MSINVTVTGNPVSIKRGRMVTCDSYQAKKEFDKRRLMRLEQVRQQSKDIAADVRNKVRQEKKKQMRQIEEDGQQKLKNWQNRKLLELQTQYEEALHELGTGHKQAINFEDEAEVLAEQKELLDKVASHRGQVAATKLQIEKNQENLKKAIPIQQKKLVRDIENTRASMVSSIKQKKVKNTDISEKGRNTKKQKKPVADINITIPSFDSDNSDFPGMDMECSPEHDKVPHKGREEPSTSSCDCIDTSNDSCSGPRQPQEQQPLDFNIDSGSGSRSESKSLHPVSPKRSEQPTAPGGSNFAKKIYERRRMIEEFLQKQNMGNPPLDTRISDRIKRRDLMTSQPDYCETVAKTHPTPFIESNTQLRDAIDAHNINNPPVEINCICGHKCPKICGSKQENAHDKIKFNETDSRTSQGRTSQKELHIEKEIPEKPPIKLKDNYDSQKITTGSSKDTIDTNDPHKVSFYDHPNRFLHEKPISSNAHVEKITTDSLEVNPNVMSETEWLEKMKQRDKEAKIRGQKALEKEKVQKDYEEILKKLPLLQKKERICEIAKDKQEYHMSEERLKERERKKQNDLDNAYAKLFPNLKPAVVTLPVKKHEKQVKSSGGEPIQSLNVGTWDVDHTEPKMFSAEEVQEIVKAFTEQQPQERRSKLKQLLKSLKLQKEQLINEIKSLPSNDSINELISDLRSFSDSDEKCGRGRKKSEKTERKRRREEYEKETTDSTTEDSSTSLSRRGKEKKKKGRGIEKTPSPRKKQKLKSKRRVLILQNMSTQTTPKASVNFDQNDIASKTDKISEPDAAKVMPVCSKLHVPCDCNKENESTDELCQIVIKINENDDPEVVVKSKEKDVKIQETVKEKSPKITKKPGLISIAVGTDELKESKSEKTVSHKTPSSSSQMKTTERSKKVAIEKHRVDPKIVETKSARSREVDSSESRAKSWKEQLSKNSVSTSSTSYLSPPDFQKTGESVQSTIINEQLKQSLYNLRKKPQQNNLSVSPSQTSVDQKITDPQLLEYIEKLLSMSRGSVENLTVSTSSVQTPSQSVIELESNNPLAQLHNLIKYVNLKDIESKLSYSPDYSPIHYNSTASTSAFTSGGSQQPSHRKSTDGGAEKTKSGKTNPSSVPSSRVAAEKDTSSCSAVSKDSVLAQYAEITDSCSRRIAELASMIEQIREEKIHILQNPPGSEEVDRAVTTDKDYSTAYMELPGSNDSSGKYSSLNSLDDEELQRRLLEIDFSLAEKLKKFTSNRPKKKSDEDEGTKEKSGPSNNMAEEANNTHAQLWSRLNRLRHERQQREQPHSEISSAIIQPPANISFVPFLSDIPKLPKLEAQPENLNSNHKRPPPSKGLSVARKFNGNISLMPHELSTIIEADSQLSTKLGSMNNSRTSQDISPRKDFELIIPPEPPIDEEPSMSKSSSKSDKSSPGQVTELSVTPKQKSTEGSMDIAPVKKSKEKESKITLKSPNHSSDGSGQSVVLTSSRSSKKSIQLSSNSSDDMETIEAMLKSIGMEWAIPTLHKTKEALALTSSSSSLELSLKKHSGNNNSSGSDVSLKQYLKKQIKISSSTLKSDGSPASFSGDLTELSSIQVNNSNVEKSHQRTSTPIISSKSTEKSAKKVVFTGDSDISSVKDAQKNSDKSNTTSYRSLSDYSQSNSDI